MDTDLFREKKFGCKYKQAKSAKATYYHQSVTRFKYID